MKLEISNDQFHDPVLEEFGQGQFVHHESWKDQEEDEKDTLDLNLVQFVVKKNLLNVVWVVKVEKEQEEELFVYSCSQHQDCVEKQTGL